MIRSNSGADLEGAGCRCADKYQHAHLVASVNRSYERDTERAALRTERSTSYLRRAALAPTNGHTA